MLTSDQKMDITENIRHLDQIKGDTDVIYFILYLYAKLLILIITSHRVMIYLLFFEFSISVQDILSALSFLNIVHD